MVKKKQTKTLTRDLDSYDFQGTLKNIRENVDWLIEQYGEEALIDLDGDQMFCGVDCTVTYERLETDEEFKQRLKKEEKQRKQKKMDRAKKEEKEKKELARLIKKYPDEVK